MNKTVYLLLAPGFEETEAICPLDLLRRAGLNVKTVAVGGERTVVSTHGIPVVADCLLEEIEGSVPDAVVLPGGMPGTNNLDVPAVHKLILSCRAAGGLLGAICAAPKILGGLGLLDGVRATCFPGFEKTLGQAVFAGYGEVQAEDRIVTASAMGYAREFGLALVRELVSKEKASELAKSVRPADD